MEEDIFDLDASVEEVPQEESQEESPDFFEQEEEQEGSPQSKEPEEEADYLTRFLKSKGINKNSIQVQNEEGETESLRFEDLTDEEKYSLLAMDNGSSITDSEIETLNYLRSNKMSLRDFAEWQRNEAIKEFQEQNSNQDYKVDMLSDEDLYKFDLTERYPDMTEDEINEEVEAAKQNESLFNKKIETLRKEYKTLEDQQTQYAEQQAKEESEAQYNQMAESLVNVARSTSDLHDLTIEDEEKEAVLSFLLDRDANGQSEFYKLFENPEALFKMAWYMKYGDQAFQAINDYYKGVIEKSRRSSQSQQPRTVRKTQSKVDSTDVFDLEGQIKNIN